MTFANQYTKDGSDLLSWPSKPPWKHPQTEQPIYSNILVHLQHNVGTVLDRLLT